VASYFEIPLDAKNQSIRVSLNGVTYGMRILWNWISALWVIDLSDANGNALVGGIPMVANIDLLGQYEFLSVGGRLVAMTDNAPDVAPTFDNLGGTGHLYFITD